MTDLRPASIEGLLGIVDLYEEVLSRADPERRDQDEELELIDESFRRAS